MKKAVILNFVLLGSVWAFAHCDTMQGPVVAAAQAALTRNDITPVLKWIRNADEAEVRRAFETTVRVRSAGPEARQLADRWFFETVVRLHRAGEGAPYTGLKSGAPEPMVRAADMALETGKADELAGKILSTVEAGLRRRYQEALAARDHADDSVDAGRAYVAAYVDFMHYLERVHQAVSGAPHHDVAASEPGH
jgi:hypothetical protein